MYQRTYFVSKRTGTFADVLAVYGLAAILDEVLAQAKRRTGQYRVWLRDAGPYYTVELSEPLRPEWVTNCAPFTLVPFVQREAKEKIIGPPDGFPQAWVRDLTAENEAFRSYLAMKRSQAESSDANTGTTVAAAEPPKSDFRVLEFIGDWKMQATGLTGKGKGFQSYNALAVRWWETISYLVADIESILEMCTLPSVEVEEIAKRWARRTKGKRPINASQLLSPAQGQGQNHPKASRLDTRHQMESFWLAEYLKAAGMWICGAPRQVAPAKAHPKAGDWRRADRKTYVLAPVGITLAAHRMVFAEFNERLWNETCIKMDITGALLFVHTWLDYVEAAYKDEMVFDQILAVPENAVAGFHVAQYKQLSEQSYTVTNLSFLGLPAWTGQAQNRAEVLRMKEVIEEHLNIVRGIDEGRSDGYNLLLRYRDFVTGGKWEAFFTFAVGYSHYLMRDLLEAARQNRRSARAFTVRNLEELMMRTNKPLSPILQSEGFRSVARAIRQSTITLQYLGRKQSPYDIRYGMAQELQRKSVDHQEFAKALGTFIQSYNAENVRTAEHEKGAWRRKDVTTADLEQVMQLVDEYGPETVCHLLVAYGYARDSKEEA